jgi:hypothetical protein
MSKIALKITKLEANYLVEERANKDISIFGSIEDAIEALERELEEMESLWGKYSSDCLGHGITCTRLKISWLERLSEN